MESVKTTIENILNTINEITNTARYVNSDSHKRKEISVESLSLIEKLMEGSGKLRSYFNEVIKILHDSQKSIDTNSNEFKSNVDTYTEVIANLKNIKNTLNSFEDGIYKLINTIDVIKNDTDEIFILALNASIESSKYSHTAKVFDILANKLNGMSSFINHNLQGIVKVIDPIMDGIHRLIDENTKVLSDIEDGYKYFVEFTDILDRQKNTVGDLIERANISAGKIDGQKKMLDDINNMVNQMSDDAAGAINGSSNVIDTGEDLSKVVHEVLREVASGKDVREKICFIESQASFIWHTAQTVNEKSKSQLDFSMNSVSFCESMITASIELYKTIDVFQEQSIDNNKIANNMSENMEQLVSKFTEIEKKINISNKTIEQFNEDYQQINNILNFLKSILKSMKIIGMYSRIESSRDPDEFAGFMTIYKNIIKLQSQIQQNIPNIEANIEKSHKLIEKINNYFTEISSVFFKISKKSSSIIGKFKDIIGISSKSQTSSQSIVEESKEIDAMLQELRHFLNELTEVAKKPIEGSAANIQSGRNIEKVCREILQNLESRNSEPASLGANS